MDNQENLTQEELQSKINYIFANSFNHTQHAYIDIAGDLIAGTLLSQIMYWFSLDKNKKSKIRIFKDGNYWLAKSREDWYEEIRISPKQYDTAVKKLKEKGLVETKLYKFNAVPTTHIRPIFAEINSEINEWKKKIELEIASGNDTDIPMSEISILPNGENGNSKSVNMEVDKRANSLTENTNSDYINRDYNTENTLNSFSTEKDIQSNSPEGEQSNSFSGEKKTAILNQTKRHSEKEMEDMVNQIPLRARRIAYEMTGDKDKAKKVYECVEYFLNEYKAHIRQRHKVLKDETLRKIVFKFTDGIEIERDGYTDVYDGLASISECVGDYKDVIDEYFNTDFNYIDEKTGEKKGVDYSLAHFTNDTVLTNMMNHVGKEDWCESN